MNRVPHVSVLGTGRMGAAMASRLSATFPVVSWSRRGGTVASVESAPRAEAAVKDAEVVLLALFDAQACQAVLSGCLPQLSASAVVVNTSTVGPHEAAALAGLVQGSGHAYLHAPVMGSVPAVRAGELTILAGGSLTDASRAVLSHLGSVVEAGSPATAAALKLVAIGSLGDCLVDVRVALHRSRAAGLDTADAISVLERSPLGTLVHAKRAQLTERNGAADADFTIGALAKDLTLLAALTGTPHRATPRIDRLRAQGHLTDEDDVAALCVAGTTTDGTARAQPDARLTISDDVDAPDDVLEPLHAYALGHATGDPNHFRRAFRPTAHIEGMREDGFQSWNLASYCALFTGPAPDEQNRSRTVDAVDVSGTVATATMTLQHGDVTFTDVFLLVEDGGEWRIANKAYHRHDV